MDKQEQITFVTALCNSIADEIIRKVEAGKIPDDWDGIEFRWLVQDYATTRFGAREKKRKRAFRSATIVNNL